MKRLYSAFISLSLLLTSLPVLAQYSAVYVGGHIRRERPGTITTLRNSGFTTVILFNVHVDSDGTLMTDGETICKDGAYVFGNTQPNYTADVKALKTYPTGVNRVEICIGGWGNDSYDHIKSLIEANGTGSGTILYRNFQALKRAIPEIDAVNNDQEQCYDYNTTVQFHTMMYDLGYKTTLAPYTGVDWWKAVAAGINANRGGAVDRMMVQCYDGGAGNDPSDWPVNGIELWAGRMNYQSSMDEAHTQFSSWKNADGVTGGFVWVYNDETWNLNAWASGINRVYNPKTTDAGVATFYQNSDYGGYAITLPEGDFPMAEMALYGLSADDVSSLKVTPGYKVTLYTGADFTGSSVTYTASSSWVGNDWNDKARSIRVEPNGVTGLRGMYKIKNRNSNLYMDCDGNSTANDAKVVQWTDEGEELYQWWELQEYAAGVYHIRPASNLNTKIELYWGKKDNGTGALMYAQTEEYWNSEFIVYEKEAGWYQLIARHCGKPLELSGASTDAGTQITIYDNNGSNCQQWALERKSAGTCAAASFYQDLNYGGYEVSLPEGSYSTWQLRMYGLSDNDVSSIRVSGGFQVTAYDNDLTGDSHTWTESSTYVGGEWNDRVSSLVVSPRGTGGKSGWYKMKGYNSQLYWTIRDNSSDNNAVLEQQAADAGAAQLFQLAETSENGVYTIRNYRSGKVIDVAFGSCDNWTTLLQWSATGAANQQWILVDKGGGWYQFTARQSGKVIEVPYNSLDAGAQLKTYTNNDQYCSWWYLESSSTTEAEASPSRDAVSVYPNPVVDVLRVTAPAGSPIRVVNALGKTVLTATAINGETPIDMRHLPSGYYMVTAGGRVSKIVK